MTMVLTPQAFLRKVIREEPNTYEGGIARKLLPWVEAVLDPDIGGEDGEETETSVFDRYLSSLRREADAVESLYRQYLKEGEPEREERRKAFKLQEASCKG